MLHSHYINLEEQVLMLKYGMYLLRDKARKHLQKLGKALFLSICPVYMQVVNTKNHEKGT